MSDTADAEHRRVGMVSDTVAAEHKGSTSSGA
jgi:hypothetical protein